MTKQPIFKVGDIVDTPYHGRRRIKAMYFQEAKFPGELETWMYEIEANERENNPAYSEAYVNSGLFICENSGLPRNKYHPSYPPRFLLS